MAEDHGYDGKYTPYPKDRITGLAYINTIIDLTGVNKVLDSQSL